MLWYHPNTELHTLCLQHHFKSTMLIIIVCMLCVYNLQVYFDPMHFNYKPMNVIMLQQVCINVIIILSKYEYSGTSPNILILSHMA